ncbi:unnamed protein product [Protopolystoma xenopodis]|uniref:Uncharacterized protein n=1 Tax=Protopolystoma xenopodis TaxID=117903 RepID=A0A448XQS2_9PLAT|nr:unnamed protein product [Protopolystoma xenopodis]
MGLTRLQEHSPHVELVRSLSGGCQNSTEFSPPLDSRRLGDQTWHKLSLLADSSRRARATGGLTPERDSMSSRQRLMK